MTAARGYVQGLNSEAPTRPWEWKSIYKKEKGREKMKVVLESIGDHSLKQTLLLQLVLHSRTMWERNPRLNPESQIWCWTPSMGHRLEA